MTGYGLVALALTFIESFATILLERGVYFFTHAQLGFSEPQNLSLAVGFGLTYAFGAKSSDWLARRLGARTALGLLLALLLAVHAGVGLSAHELLLTSGFLVTGLLEGAKWPIIESYVAAGHEDDDQRRALGRFNLSWSFAVPLSLGLSGALIDSAQPLSLFWLAAGLNLVSWGLTFKLGRTPPAHGPPPTPAPGGELDPQRLLRSSRWLMFGSYSLLFLIAPLLPQVLQALGASTSMSTIWASGLDLVRGLTFATLAVTGAWQGRRALLAASAIGLPLSFACVLWGPTLPVVLAGEAVFGLLAGFTYFSALAYTMRLRQASIDAGGAHESLIGLGLAVGPGLGLLGHALAQRLPPKAAISVGVLPLVIACVAGALRPLVAFRPAAKR